MNNEDISKVYLLSVPLENDYEHTLYFGSIDSQVAYFSNKVVKSYTNFTYQRKDNLIYVPEHYDNIFNVNYVMYQNSKYNNKWFYAFVKNLKYENNECTILEIETDVMQTWLFDYQVKSSFVEREHVNDDTVGLHTIPEQLETGEYIVNKHTQANYGGDLNGWGADRLAIVVGVTKDPEGERFEGGIYNNIYSGLKYHIFRNTNTGIDELNTFINSYSSDAANDAIITMFLVPLKLVQFRDGVHDTLVQSMYPNSRYINHPSEEDDVAGINDLIDISTNKINNYTPKNKKLLCSPYRYLLTSNNAGTDVVYNYEDFKDKKPRFLIEGCVTPGGSIRMIPMYYKGDEYNHSEGINLGKFPTLNWNTDYFTNWLTANAVNVGVSTVSNVAQIVGGIGLIASGGGALVGAGMLASGLISTTNSLGQVYQHSKVPPQSQGNINNGDVISASNKNDFHFYDMTIKEEYAKAIDRYFDMYGYKVNTRKIPNKNHRESFWFTKTISVNIVGNIPQDDLIKIKNVYNKGITFWKNTSQIKNYDVSNGIIS